MQAKLFFKKSVLLDELEIPSYPSAYVINSETHDQPGEHWVAVYFDQHGRGEYFDSYGLPSLGCLTGALHETMFCGRMDL